MNDEEFIEWFKETLYEAVAKEFVARNSVVFVESEHPRDKDGKFTKKGGGQAVTLNKDKIFYKDNRSSTGVSEKAKKVNEDSFAKEIKDYPSGGYTNKNSGIKRNQDRSFQQAMDEFAKHEGKLKNLPKYKQILIFELLMRGYDMSQEDYSYHNPAREGEYTFISNENFRVPKNVHFKNKDEAVLYLNKFIAPKARYVLAYSYKNSKLYDECEIVEVFKNAEQKLRFFDVKQGKIFDESILDNIRYTYRYNGQDRPDHLQLFRIDNQEFNPKIIKMLMN